MDGLTAGRIVLFGLGVDPAGRIAERPAIVVRVWDNGGCNLQVFTDGNNDDAFLRPDETSARDDRRRARSVVWRTSVQPVDRYDVAQVDRWRWPPRAVAAPRTADEARHG